MHQHFANESVTDYFDRLLEFGTPTPSPEPYVPDITDTASAKAARAADRARVKEIALRHLRQNGFMGPPDPSAWLVEPTTIIIGLAVVGTAGLLAWWFWPQSVTDCVVCLAKNLTRCACNDQA